MDERNSNKRVEKNEPILIMGNLIWTIPRKLCRDLVSHRRRITEENPRISITECAFLSLTYTRTSEKYTLLYNLLD